MAAVPHSSTNGAPDADATTDQRIFLDSFPPARRSYVANTFLHAVRAGARTPEQVLAAVEAELRAVHIRAQRWGGVDTIDRTKDIYAALNEHHDDALAFAAWAISWEALPPAERERQKQAKGEAHRRAWMEQQPATEKQVAYVRALGFTGEVTSKAHASQLIDQLRTRAAEVQR